MEDLTTTFNGVLDTTAAVDDVETTTFGGLDTATGTQPQGSGSDPSGDYIRKRPSIKKSSNNTSIRILIRLKIGRFCVECLTQI